MVDYIWKPVKSYLVVRVLCVSLLFHTFPILALPFVVDRLSHDKVANDEGTFFWILILFLLAGIVIESSVIGYKIYSK